MILQFLWNDVQYQVEVPEDSNKYTFKVVVPKSGGIVLHSKEWPPTAETMEKVVFGDDFTYTSDDALVGDLHAVLAKPA